MITPNKELELAGKLSEFGRKLEARFRMQSDQGYTYKEYLWDIGVPCKYCGARRNKWDQPPTTHHPNCAFIEKVHETAKANKWWRVLWRKIISMRHLTP